MTRRAGTSEAEWQRRMMEDEARSSAMLRQISKNTREKVEVSQKKEIQAWIDRNRWAEYLQGKHRPTLMKLIKPPIEPVNERIPATQQQHQQQQQRDEEEEEEEEDNDEPVLREICRRFLRLAHVAQQTTIKRVNIFTRFAINRKDINKEPSKPFNGRMESSTMDRYCQVWVKMICYIIRTYKEQQQQQQQGGSRTAAAPDSGYVMQNDSDHQNRPASSATSSATSSAASNNGMSDRAFGGASGGAFGRASGGAFNEPSITASIAASIAESSAITSPPALSPPASSPAERLTEYSNDGSSSICQKIRFQ